MHCQRFMWNLNTDAKIFFNLKIKYASHLAAYSVPLTPSASHAHKQERVSKTKAILIARPQNWNVQLEAGSFWAFAQLLKLYATERYF